MLEMKIIPPWYKAYVQLGGSVVDLGEETVSYVGLPMSSKMFGILAIICINYHSRSPPILRACPFGTITSLCLLLLKQQKSKLYQ